MGKTKTKQSTDSNQTTTAAPPSWTAGGLSQAGQMVQDALGQIPTQHYSGQQVASMSPEELKAITDAWGATANNAGDLSGWLQGMLPQVTQGQNFTTSLPDTSYSLAPKQELDSVIRASIAPVQRQLMEQILPGMTNSALAAGAYSNDRAMRVLPTDAVRNATESMQNIAAQLGYEDYNNYENRRLQAYQATTGASQQNYALDTARQQEEQALRLQALGMAPDFVNSILHTQASQGDLLRMAADLRQQQGQLGINDALARDQYASQSPFMGLDTASELLARLSGGYGTTNSTGHSTTTTTQSQDPTGQIIQGALGLGMAAMGMPGGLGGLGGLFGGGSSLAAGGATAGSLFGTSGSILDPQALLPFLGH